MQPYETRRAALGLKDIKHPPEAESNEILNRTDMGEFHKISTIPGKSNLFPLYSLLATDVRTITK